MSVPAGDAERLVLTIEEAARLLRVGETTLRDHLRRGEIPHVRLGRRVLIRRDTLLAWIEAREAASVRAGAGR